MLSLAVVPVISVAVRRFGRYMRELSHKTQAAAAVASSIAEVCHFAHIGSRFYTKYGNVNWFSQYSFLHVKYTVVF